MHLAGLPCVLTMMLLHAAAAAQAHVALFICGTSQSRLFIFYLAPGGAEDASPAIVAAELKPPKPAGAGGVGGMLGRATSLVGSVLSFGWAAAGGAPAAD